MVLDLKYHRYYLGLLCWWLLWLVGCGNTAVSPPTPTPLSPEEAVGKAVYVRYCGACHSTQLETIIVGPSLAGVATRAATRVPDQDARTYLYTSILEPDRYLVEGFPNSMPNNFGKQLSGEELDAVVAYLFTLR